MDNIDTEFEELKSFGIGKIVDDTYIGHSTMQAILDRDFGYFQDKTKALRFIKIIHSQYGFELKGWLDDYYKYREVNMLDDEKEETSLLDVSQAPYVEYSRVNYTPYIIVVVIILIVVVIAMMMPDDQEKEIVIQKEQIDTKKELEEVLNKKPEITKYKVNSKTLAIVPLSKSRHSRPLTTQESINDELNPEIADILDRDIVIDLNNSIIDIQNNDLTIRSNLGRMWIGIIDIDTYDRKSDIVEDEKTFPMYDNTIFITGHGHFTLSSGENTHTISNGKKQYFYYKNGNFIQLKRIEYLFINKGIEW